MGILRTDKISGSEKPTSITSSVYFDGDARNDNLNFAGDPPDLDFQNTDFTFESWVYPTDMSSNRYWCSKGDGNLPGTAMDVRFDSDGQINISFYVGSNAHTLNTDPGVLQENVWSHVAVVRSGTSFKSYVNGIETSSATHDITISDVSATFKIGILEGVGTGFKGYMSDFRFVRGKAVYTEEFTPPVYALEPIDGTVLLCCNNPDSVSAVSLAGIGTSKTITVNGDVSIASTNPGSLKDFTYGTEFKGVTTFDTQGYFVPPSGTTTERYANVTKQASSSARGVFMGGLTPAAAASTDTIDFVTITSAGNATGFGDLDAARRLGAACSSSTRGVGMGGFQPAAVDIIQYVTIASTGNTQDFGNLSASKHSVGGSANSTRGLAFGSSGTINTIEYITIASTGDAQDFGDMFDGLGQVTGTSSPTRCVMASGESPSRINTMQYVTIMSMGNAFIFGDLTVARSGVCSFSNATRGLYLGGELPASPNFTNTVDFVNIASTGNAIDFGDLDDSNGLRLAGTAATPTRGLYAGGGNDTPASNTAYAKIHLFNIASTGDATDFGDLTQARFQVFNGTVSDSHGGLS